MAHKLPPVPPDQRSPKPASPKSTQIEQAGKSNSIPDNLHEQGEQGNIYQNTRNQGYQQDR